VKPIRIGTRGSMLAKWQAEFVRKKILEATGVDAEIVIIKTTGDKLQTASFAQIAGKGVFIKELEEALLNQEIDLAVHSVKDIPTEVPSRLCFPVICRREDTRDCLVAAQNETLSTLRHGARIGTSSLRRRAQILHARRDLDVRELRGNVDTRLRKVASGEYDAILLAKAGLDRLGWSNRISEVLAPDVCMPAVGQGALGVQARLRDNDIADALAPLDDFETRQSIVAERSLLAALQGGCQVPLGAWARFERGELAIDAVVCSPDGSQHVRQRAIAPPDQARELGQRVAQMLIDSGAREILEEVYRQRG
jgi:hydroxymethylbilane synthase